MIESYKSRDTSISYALEDAYFQKQEIKNLRVFSWCRPMVEPVLSRATKICLKVIDFVASIGVDDEVLEIFSNEDARQVGRVNENMFKLSKLENIPYEILHVIFLKLPLTNRLAVIRSSKRLKAYCADRILENLSNDDICEHLRTSLHSSKIIKHDFYANVVKSLFWRTIRVIALHGSIYFCGKWLNAYIDKLPEITQEFADEHNKQLGLPGKYYYGGYPGSSSYYKEAFTVEELKERRESARYLPTFLRIVAVVRDLYSLYKDFTVNWTKDFLDNCVEYPLSLSSDPILSQYTVNATHRVPLIPCYSLNGVYHDYFRTMKASWNSNQQNPITVTLDVDSFKAIQERIAELKEQGNPLAANVYCFKEWSSISEA